jgi:hypothetical protein
VIGKQSLSEAFVQMVLHLLIVLCCSFVCVDACHHDEGLTCCFECAGIDLVLFGKETDFSLVLICELNNVSGPFVPFHHAYPIF